MYGIFLTCRVRNIYSIEWLQHLLDLFAEKVVIFTLSLPQYGVRGYRRHEQCDGWGTHDGCQ